MATRRLVQLALPLLAVRLGAADAAADAPAPYRVLAPADGAVVATIDVGGAPELVAVDGAGRLYTNLEDKDRVAAVDTVGHRLIASWPLAPGAGPSGVAIDARHHRLFSACHDTKT